MEDKQNNSWSLKKTLYAIGYGIQRSAGLIIEYPLECIKTRWQAHSEIKSFRNIVLYSYRKYGVFGFYDGIIPSAARKIPMQAYRWPLLLQLPKHYEGYFDNTESKKSTHKYLKIIISNFLTGMTIASVETLLASPIEGCKLDLIVNRDSTKSILQYLKENNSFKKHYLGVEALFLKEAFGWVSFLVSCNLLRQLLKDYNQEKSTQLHQLMGLSMAVGCINATAIMPWDVARSQIQKHRNENMSLIETTKTIVKNQGISGLYRGWGIRFFQMTVATTLSVPIMEKFESHTQSLKNH